MEPYLAGDALDATRRAVAAFAAPDGAGRALHARLLAAKAAADARNEGSWLTDLWLEKVSNSIIVTPCAVARSLIRSALRRTVCGEEIVA